MKVDISLIIRYYTVWGQRIFAEFGDDNAKRTYEMSYLHDGEWALTIKCPISTKALTYRYFVEDSNGQRTFENFRAVHKLRINSDQSKYLIYDRWIPEDEDRTFYTSAFAKNIFARKTDNQINQDLQSVNIRLAAPLINPNHTIAITGNQKCLGNWSVKNALPLSDTNFPEWSISIDIKNLQFPLEYKYIVKDIETGKLCYWEDGFNRVLNIPPDSEDKTLIIYDFPLKTPFSVPKWSGIVIPVFSLRSKDSFGIGDLGDMFKLIDLAKQTGLHFIQVLPMNDTTREHSWRDSYPYSAISVFALHPLYISLKMLGKLKDRQKRISCQNIKRRLNKNVTVDYQSVDQHKTYYCREYFNQEKDNILNDREFQQFVNENKDWLIPYAAFSTLRDKYHTADFSQWGEYARYDSDTASKICDKYFFFIQFALHKQFSAVASYARSNRIVLKGDIPIGINRESVEAWTEPEYFNMNGQTGAPPDDFSDTGQNWSFPTYNWDVMEKDDYGWWKKRFCKLGAYFDCFRIDHILGFFRIWEIPCDYIDGLCGHFRPALPLTKTELANYGLNYREEWTTPRINTMFLNEIFGDIPFSELQEYLTYSDADHLTLSALYSTQRKIALHQDCNKTVTEGLMRIATEVLFVKDPYQPDSFHPRISAYKSFIYRELTHKEKSIFDKLYYDFYYVRHNEFWKQTALKRLTPLVQSTEMLVCGEDLGMIPATVHEVMDKLQIFTLELERAPKLYGVEFANLAQLPLHSVCTTSTHDMNPVRAWWKEVPDRTQRYYNEILKRSGAAPSECSADIATQIITGHLRSSSMLVIIPFQDWLATDDDIKYPDADAERINIPSDPDNYWRYRMHVMLENPHLYSVLTKMVKMGNSNTVTSVSAE